MVHEFRTLLTTDIKMTANAKALDDFLRLLLAKNGAADETFQLRLGQMVGPISIADRKAPGSRQLPFRIPFFIGKIRTHRTLRMR